MSSAAVASGSGIALAKADDATTEEPTMASPRSAAGEFSGRGPIIRKYVDFLSRCVHPPSPAQAGVERASQAATAQPPCTQKQRRL